MAMGETVSKIAKGIGKGLKNNVVAEDIDSVVKATKKFGKKINKKYLTDVPEKQEFDSLMYAVFPRKIKKRYVYGTGAVVGGIAIANTLGDAQDRASYGQIEGGGLSHMTSEVSSTLISEMQEGNYDPARIMHNSSYRDTGASGDIVMALHNRR